MRTRALLLLPALLPMLSFTPAPAVAGTAEDAAAIYADFMSPWCPGLLLRDCRSTPAVELREEVARELAAGASAGVVRERLEQRFGEKILAAPHASGFGLVAWLTPFALVALCSLATVAWIRSHRGDLDAPPARRATSDTDRERLLAELRSEGEA